MKSVVVKCISKLLNIWCFSLDYILGPLIVFPGKKPAYDDNFVDRINRYYTVTIILFFNIYVCTEEYVGEPIYCWCPPEFEEFDVWYVDYVCWVSNTYYLPFSKPIPPKYEHRQTDGVEITYYQWVPLILFLMALTLYLPRLFLRVGIQWAGIEVRKMVVLVKHFNFSSPEEREMRLRKIAAYIDVWCAGVNRYRAGMSAIFRERLSTLCPIGCGRHYGNYLITLMIFIRFIYLFNAVGTLFFLNEFLGNKFYIYGFEVMDAVFKGKEWMMSPRFPRITLCEMDLRQLTNIHRYTFQCVLPINFYNEKIFLFLWFWYVILSFLCFCNFLLTISQALIPRINESFVKKYLRMIDVIDDPKISKKLVHKFIHNYLRHDGVYIIKEISRNGNTANTTEMMQYIWESFLERQNQYERVVYGSQLKCNMSLLHAYHTSPPLIISNGTLSHISEEELIKKYGNETFV